MSKLFAVMAAFLFGLAGTSASAVTFNLVGVSSSNTTATVDFTYDGINTLTIAITNTASVSPDPRLTNFVFNAPSEVTGVTSFTALGTANDSDWMSTFNPDSLNTPGNNGQFDIGAITGPNTNSGSPNSGIVVNTMATFTIVLSGDTGDLASLTEASFLDLLSQGGNNAWVFGARFQRLADGNVTSDFAVGAPSPVPLPAGGLLLIGALGALTARRRRATA
ncbi:hypothetical protein A8B78_21820 [Jannaschia sp. EhC01]|nr:hypothetical protein A8B78_21820 [Jannaschia sp. EhC01]